MEKEVKREAFRQYLHYFRFWFIAVAILAVVAVGAKFAKYLQENRPRENKEADVRRVYDLADMLTDEEEKDLEDYIAGYEKKARIDIVLVVAKQPMGVDDTTWENNMMTLADDTYDNGKYGYDKPYGDGALLLYNWYVDPETKQSHKGVWLSTSGKMERMIGAREEDKILDELEKYIFRDPNKAYKAAIKELAAQAKVQKTSSDMAPGVVVMIPLVVAFIYLISNLSQSKPKSTTHATTYVENGKPVINNRSDEFLRKNVVSHRIESSSSSSGGSSHHSGGGSHGSHSSSSGHSHGGGGRRH